MVATLATLVLAAASSAWAAEAPERCDLGWPGAEVLKGKAATVAAIVAHKGRPLIVEAAELKGADFSGRDLANVCFADGDLSDSHWARATLHGVAFAFADLEGADFDLATANGVGIYRAHLSGMRGRQSKWRDLAIVDGMLDGGRMDFTGAELTRAEWRCEMEPEFCNQQSDLDLREGRLDGFRYRSDWQRLKLEGTTVLNTRIEVRHLTLYAKAKVLGDVQIAGRGHTDLTVRLTPQEWDQLKNGLTERRPPLLTAKSRSFAAGETQFFGDAGAGFSREFRNTPTYAKLIPILYQSSRQKLYITGLGGDRISAVGGGAAARGHYCDFEAELSLRRDGWYGLKDEDNKWWDVLRVQGNRLEFNQDYENNAYLCGVGVGLDELWLVPVSPDILKKKDYQ